MKWLRGVCPPALRLFNDAKQSKRALERPDDLVVYGGIGKAARNWDCFEAILESLRNLHEDETLLVQSGKPVGVFRTHADAPRVLIANSNLVPKWATWEHFHELDRKGLMMYGQMTAGSWIYIGSQGIVQGTYETFVEAARQHFAGSLSGKWILTAGLGGMGGAQPLAATFAGARARSAVGGRRGERIDGGPCPGDARFPGGRRAHGRLRQQYPSGREGCGRRSRLC